jgi:poly-gamma-glutamate synthesis protein (capsule biosynthesis protein)
MNYPLPELRTVYQEFVDLGADAVIASHPHVPQGWETYKGRPIYYSLGNFFFDKMKGPVSFVFNGLVAVIEFSESGINLRTVVTKRVENRVELENDKEVIAQVEGFAETLKDDRAYMEKVNEGVARLHGKYEGWMLGGLNAIKLRPSLKTAYHAFRKLFGKQRTEVTMHQIREDSTRWLLQREYKRGGGVQL